MNELQAGPKSTRGGLAKLPAVAIVFILVGGGAWLIVEIAGQSARQKAQIEKAALYDVSSLLKVDPSLIRYREASRFATGMKKPTVLALGKEEILVGGDRAIARFDQTGRKLGEIALPAEPTALAVDSSGMIFIGLMDHVEVFSADGKRNQQWKSLGERSQIAGLAITGDGVWIADGGQRKIVRAEQGAMGKAFGDFLIPSPRHMDIVAGQDGLVWVADTGRHQIKAFRADGNMQTFWGEGGVKIEHFTGCCNPADFCILPDGSFITAEKGLPRVKKYSADGKFQCVVLAADRAEDNAEGIDVAADAKGTIYLLDRTKKVVRLMVAKEKG